MTTSKKTFADFSFQKPLLTAIQDLGYEHPTPVQAQSIPVLLEGHDLLAQAQTGTGKTAAFALPILSRIDHTIKTPQVLVLAPTRELAIQVATAFQDYAKHMKGFVASPIYGGQSFDIQFRALKRGPQVIVGTPGRIMDHLRRGTLTLDTVKMLVLDEADEMLKMGFVDDVEWILSHIKAPHQTALFSATLPSSIIKIAQKYLKNAKRIEIKSEKNTVETIKQCYVPVSRDQKLSVLMKFLAIEESKGVIIFARTKNDSAVLAEKLQTHGYAAAALNGDMNQASREKTIDRLKSGALNIIVATDVAARGIDVERVTHVFNYDIPFDVDSYVHRIGRTGRAGREGMAILFVTPREMRMLSAIERHTNRPIKRINPPDAAAILEHRVAQLTQQLDKVIKAQGEKLSPYIEQVKKISHQCECSTKELAAALLYLKDIKTVVHDDYKDPTPKKTESGDRGRKRFGFSGDRDRDRAREGARGGQGRRKPFSDRAVNRERTRKKDKQK